MQGLTHYCAPQEMYDLATDPWQQKNIVNASTAAAKAALKKELHAWCLPQTIYRGTKARILRVTSGLILHIMFPGAGTNARATLARSATRESVLRLRRRGAGGMASHGRVTRKVSTLEFVFSRNRLPVLSAQDGIAELRAIVLLRVTLQFCNQVVD